MKIKDWLTKERWIQHTFSAGLNGWEEEYYQNPKIKKACLLGSIYYCYPEEEVHEIVQLILSYLKCNIPCWNDNPKRTWEDVQALVEELDI